MGINMGEIFLKLLNISITAGWFILAVSGIRLIFRRIPRWMLCLLWGAVSIRLICPFSIESRFCILSSTTPIKADTVVGGEIQNHIPSIDSHLTIVENTINPMLGEAFAYNEAESAAPLQVAVYAAGMVWLCGMILLFICAMAGTIRLYRLVREGVCIRDNIYICDAVKSPFILGVVRPRIYLPSALDEKEINYILAHEAAHLKRKDHWWKPLGYLLLCIYWFNPLCWAAYAMFCRDIELACDEKAAGDMTFHEKKEYSRVLLSCAGQGSLIMACPLAFGEVGVKERVKSVLHYKKPALWLILAASAVCAIMAVCFLTDPAREYQIRITIPPGSTEIFHYSDEEISPRGDTLTFYAGEGLGDTEIILLPIEVRKENAYDAPAYITPGMPVEMEAEKGAWYKIGVNIQNSTDESREVYVSVKNVEVRIASSLGSGESGESGLEPERTQGETPGKEEAGQQGTVTDVQAEKNSIQDLMLYEQPEAGKVCIKLRSSLTEENSFYYYIPAGKDQEWLSKRVEALDLEGEPWEKRWEGHEEKGWQIIYNDVELRVFEGGYVYYTYDDETGMMECFIEDPKLCDYIQILLQEEIGRERFFTYFY